MLVDLTGTVDLYQSVVNHMGVSQNVILFSNYHHCITIACDAFKLVGFNGTQLETGATEFDIKVQSITSVGK